MQLFLFIFVIWAIYYFWPWIILGLGAWILLRKFVLETHDPHVGYVIIKDGLGKFGITRKNNKLPHQAVNKRYGYQPIKILWTGELKNRSSAYAFEKYCKNFVKEIVRGREWTTQQEARVLAWNLKNSVRWSWVPQSGHPPIDKPGDP